MRNEKSSIAGSSSHTFIISFLGAFILAYSIDTFKKQFPQKRNVKAFSPCITRGKRYKVCTPSSVGKGKNYA